MEEAMDRQPTPTEFSRPYRLSELQPDGASVDLEAGPEECEALARRFDVVAIDRLTARLYLKRDARDRHFLVRGSFEAGLTQICVVTLEPFEATLVDSFTARFVRDAAAAQETDVFVDVADGEPPEPISGETIDLGELVAQYLSLAIDPHPRKPGARFDFVDAADAGDAEEGRSPFAALKVLRGGRGS
jgi:uncharacterized metal-binding protein YceD (DUF177 family)